MSLTSSLLQLVVCFAALCSSVAARLGSADVPKAAVLENTASIPLPVPENALEETSLIGVADLSSSTESQIGKTPEEIDREALVGVVSPPAASGSDETTKPVHEISVAGLVGDSDSTLDSGIGKTNEPMDETSVAGVVSSVPVESGMDGGIAPAEEGPLDGLASVSIPDDIPSAETIKPAEESFVAGSVGTVASGSEKTTQSADEGSVAGLVSLDVPAQSGSEKTIEPVDDASVVGAVDLKAPDNIGSEKAAEAFPERLDVVAGDLSPPGERENEKPADAFVDKSVVGAFRPEPASPSWRSLLPWFLAFPILLIMLGLMRRNANKKRKPLKAADDSLSYLFKAKQLEVARQSQKS